MNAMTEFTFHTHAVRVFPTDDNTSFVVVAADVASALGYSRTSDFLRLIPDAHKGAHKCRTLGGWQEMVVIDEPGMYYGTLRSNQPEAQPMMEWVCANVLPSIRRTGSYVHPATMQAQLALAQEVGQLRDDFRAMQAEFVGVLKSHVKTSERCVRLQRQVGSLKERIAVRARIDSAVSMLSAGMPRGEIVAALGITYNYLRQIVLRARRDGRLHLDDPQMALI